MVLSHLEIQNRLERVLLRVQKPGRYVGGELNQVNKPWSEVKTHVALAFPDIYDLGLPNLGLAILYDALNQRPDILAERAYLPWLDMEEVMLQEGIPLYSLESKHPLAAFDILGITLPYETLYTNTLNLLSLAQIPLYASERNENHPLVIAGGHACFNPEPMSVFMDAFVIGEGEEVLLELIQVHQDWKSSGQDRNALLHSLTKIPGIYVPSLYQPSYNPEGTLRVVAPLEADLPRTIIKRIVNRLPAPPTHFLVPNIDVVHNRIAVEIMRGCTRGCRFCQAGMINRPVRERPVDEILTAIEQALEYTGFEEVALLSLSSSDYTHIEDLVDAIGERFKGRHLRVSLPSLRIESFSVNLIEKLRDSRQGGFTLAPEAASDRMRSIINKPISSEQLLDTAQAIYSRGWLTIKLYFMIGHPSETIEDVQAIADLCKAVLNEGRKIAGRRVSVHVGVSTFVPKPHTPFQWVPLDTEEQIIAKQRVLQKTLVGPGFKLNWTAPHETQLESWLTRGDRRLGAVIYEAWKNGAKFDAWQDQFNYAAWMQAFETCGLSPDFYTSRDRPLTEVFPWDHISIGVTKEFIKQDYLMSLKEMTRPDCREQCYACGILPTFTEMRRNNPGPLWRCPEVAPLSTHIIN